MPLRALLLLQLPLCRRLGDRCINRIRLDRLQQVIDAPVPHRLTNKIKVVASAYDDKFHRSGQFMNSGHQIDSASFRHHHIHDDNGRLVSSHPFNSLEAARCFLYFSNAVLLPIHKQSNRFTYTRLVIYD
ncbi:hypothetical protein D3C78_1408350 [compost metagenome]